MALTKEALVQSICWATDLRKCDAVKTVESLFEIVKRTLASGDDVLISGFGKFCVKNKGKCRGRNPHTGEDLMLAERRVVTLMVPITAMIRAGILFDIIGGLVIWAGLYLLLPVIGVA